MTHSDENHNEILQKISEAEKRINLRLDSMDSKINPMFEIFSSVQGFNGVAVWMMKILAGIGAMLVGIYTLLEFFKKLAR